MIVPQWLKDWLSETIQRWKSKRPKYFLYLGRIGDIMIMISGLPYLMVQVETILSSFGVDFVWPAIITTLSNKLVTGIGIGMTIASRLAVKSTVVAQTTEGQAVTVMDKTNMPFTEKSEAKEIKEAVPPPPIVSEVPDIKDIPNRD